MTKKSTKNMSDAKKSSPLIIISLITLLLIVAGVLAYTVWYLPQGQAATDGPLDDEEFFQTCSAAEDCSGYCGTHSCVRAYCSGSADPVPGYCHCKSTCDFDQIP